MARTSYKDKDWNRQIEYMAKIIEEEQEKNKDKKIEQLQFSWNSLREYCKEYADKDTMSSIIFGVVLDKMNELEGVDNENNGIKH